MGRQVFLKKLGYPAFAQGYGGQAPFSEELHMFFVYILRSIDYPQEIYVGYTINVENRLKEHNLGLSFHTSKYKPWKLLTSINFHDQSSALVFEKYLKSGSGRAFLKKYFL
jgi:putative endonuclease